MMNNSVLIQPYVSLTRAPQSPFWYVAVRLPFDQHRGKPRSFVRSTREKNVVDAMTKVQEVLSDMKGRLADEGFDPEFLDNEQQTVESVTKFWDDALGFDDEEDDENVIGEDDDDYPPEGTEEDGRIADLKNFVEELCFRSEEAEVTVAWYRAFATTAKMYLRQNMIDEALAALENIEDN